MCPAALFVNIAGMMGQIYQSLEPVTLVGGGEMTAASLHEVLALAPSLVAADGGANLLSALGKRPDALIGDLDSVLPQVRDQIRAENVLHVSEQETTDFEKCLVRIAAPLILGVGFTGARVDHALAVWNALVRHPDRPCLILSELDVAFVLPRRTRLALAPGTRVSLFPMGRVGVVSSGLRWPTEGIAFAPDGPIGTSNMATGPVTLTADAPRMVAILPRDCLRQAIAARTGPQSPADRWGGARSG